VVDEEIDEVLKTPEGLHQSSILGQIEKNPGSLDQSHWKKRTLLANWA
jgi:hypothetical protein